MKTLFYSSVVTVIFCVFPSLLNAQYYKFEQDFEEYKSINQPDRIIETNLSAGINVNYPNPRMIFFGQNAGPQNVGMGSGGYVVLTDNKYSYALDPCASDLIAHKNGSALMMKRQTMGTDTAIIFEWKNMGLLKHPETDFINFQMRWYEISKNIEFVYGPSQITSDSAFKSWGGILATINWLTRDFSGAYQQCYLMGNPKSPSYITGGGTRFLDSIPPNGTVYRFVDENFQSPSTIIQEPMNQKTGDVLIFPNPANNSIQIYSNNLTINEIEVFDLIGNRVMGVKNIDAKIETIDTSTLPSGAYMVRFNSNEMPLTKVFIKN